MDPNFSTTTKVPMDELKEVIEFPKPAPLRDSSGVILSNAVAAQLRAYVGAVSTMYRDNAFHRCAGPAGPSDL